MVQNLPAIERYTIKNGLSQNFIYTIAQDHDGLLWFGTKDGLNCFDGYTFRVFRHRIGDTTSLSSNNIYSLCVDSTGTLWIGTGGGGLNRFDRTSMTFSALQLSVAGALEQNLEHIEKIYAGPRGTLIVITTKGDVGSVDPHGGTFRAFPYKPKDISYIVKAAFWESDSSVWIASKGRGLFHYSPITQTTTHYLKGGGTAAPANDRLESIFKDSRGDIWFGHQFGYDRYITSAKTFDHHPIVPGPESWIGISMIETVPGKFFASGFSGSGTYDPDTRQLHSTEFNKGSTVTFLDRSGILWISDGGLGVIRYNPEVQRFNKRPGRMAIEINRNDLERLQRHRTIQITEPPLDHFSIVKDHHGMLWFFEKGAALFRYDTVRDQLLRFGLNDPARGIPLPFIDRIILDENNTVWIAQDMKLARYDQTSGTFTSFDLTAYIDEPAAIVNKTEYVSITTVCTDSAGIHWIGTSGMGLLRFDEQRKKVSQFRKNAADPGTLSNDFVLAIHNDPFDASRLWLGTDGGGLLRFDTKTSTVTHRFSSSNGLPNNVIYAILGAEDGKLWISSNYGIFTFDPRALTMVSRFDESDGLQDNEFNRFEYYRDADGKFYFGGIGGWNSFDPKNIHPRSFSPAVVFTDLKISNRSVSYPPALPLSSSIWSTHSIELRPEQNIFTIEFASLDYSSPGKNLFRYRLDDFDHDWSEPGTGHSVTYTNLDPGTYTFRVIGTNSEGVWNASEASLQIVVLPPFYRTWWFLGGITAAVLGIATFSIKRRFQLLRKEQLQQQEFSRQMIRQQEQDRERIATELHDSIGQNLLVVKNRLFLSLRTVEGNSEAKQHLDVISSVVSDSLAEVRQISYNLHPYQLDRLGLTEAIRSVIKTVSDASSVTFTQEIDEIDGLFPKQQEINIYRIVQECLNNILKHSGATEASVMVRRTGPIVKMSICDNGKGLSNPSTKEHVGLGMRGMKERITMLHGTIAFHTSSSSFPSSNAGLTVSITLPTQENEKY